MMVFVRRTLFVLSLLFVLGWFIPEGSGSHDFGKDTIMVAQDGRLQVDANGAAIGVGTTYWQFGKRFMFDYVHHAQPYSAKVCKGVGFMGESTSAMLSYAPGYFNVIIEGYWLVFAASLGAFPLLHSVWGWRCRRNAGRGFPID
jgi:hypothetical protein